MAEPSADSPAYAALAGAPASNPPGNGMIDVSSLITAAGAARDSIATSRADAERAAIASANAGKTEQTGIETSTSALQAIASMQGVAMARRQSDNLAAFARFGTDPHEASYAIGDMEDGIKTAQNNLNNQRSLIISKSQQSFLDDPLQWITNQVSLPFDQYTAEVMEEDVTSRRGALNDLLAKNNQIDSSNALIDQANAEDLAKQETKKLLGLSLVEVGKSQQAALKLGLEANSMKLTATVQQFDAAYKVQSAQSTATQLQLESDKNNIAERQLESDLQYKKIVEAAMVRDQAGVQALQDRLNNLAFVTGLDPISATEFLKYDAKSRASIEAIMNNVNVLGGRYGLDPASALDLVAGAKLPTNDGVRPVIDKIASIRSDTIKGNELIWKEFAPIAQNKLINDNVIKQVQSEFASNRLRDGIYSPLSLGASLIVSPLVKESPLGEALGVIAKANSSTPTDPNLVLMEAQKLVEAGTLSPGDAAKNVSMLYQGMQAELDRVRQFSKMAIPNLSGKSYNMSVGSSYSKTTIDMTKVPALESYLTRTIMREQMEKDSAGAFVQ